MIAVPSPGNRAPVSESLERVGLKILVVDPETIAGIEQAMRQHRRMPLAAPKRGASWWRASAQSRRDSSSALECGATADADGRRAQPAGGVWATACVSMS